MRHLYVAAALIEAAELGEIGTDLFIGDLPSDVTEGVELREPTYGADLDSEQNGFTKHEFHVICRGANPKEAWEKVLAIGDALRVKNVAGEGVKIREMYPISHPATYPKNDSDQTETSVNVRVWFALT